MDKGQQRGKWKKKDRLSLIFILACLPSCLAVPHNNQSETCREDEYKSTTTGFCCNKCNPGFRLQEECKGQGLRSSCTKCLNETYQQHSNYAKTCFRCKKCKTAEYEEELSPCQHNRDRECGCINGFYKEKININTWQCRACRECRDGERMIKDCTPTRNRECECETHHYRLNGRCLKCLRPTDHEQCKQMYGSTTPAAPSVRSSNSPPDPQKHPFFVTSMAFFIVSITAALGFFIYKMNKVLQKRGAIRSRPPESPADQTTPSETLLSRDPSDRDMWKESISKPIQISTETRNPPAQLPDCVPKEFKISQFIYFVLDHVPAARFKELVRQLGVSEREIERAERDNRSFKECQYQMLRVWSEAGGGEAGGTLSSLLSQELVKTLRMMGLAGCAEVIENEFSIQ